jgi:cytochrome c6
MPSIRKRIPKLAFPALLGVALLFPLLPALAQDSGADLFKTKCAGCHGADGKGKPAMKTKDLASDEVQKKSDADLAGVITNGQPPMPAYKTLSADQVKDLVGYIRSLKK